jgi:opacity protein-like surface antigen
MKKSLFLMAGALLAATSLSVSAQAVKSDSGFYLGVEGGLANTGKNQSTPGYRVISDVSKVGFMRGVAGYRFSGNMALEAGYFGTRDAKLEQSNGTRSDHVHANVRGSDLAAIYKFSDGLPGLFLKGGLSYATLSISETTTTAGSSIQRKGSSTGMGYLLGVGYELDLSRNLSANVGYTRYQRVAGLENSKLGVISAGAKYRF